MGEAQTQTNQSQKKQYETLETKINEENIPYGSDLADSLKKAEKGARTIADPKKRILEYTKIVAKELGNEYSVWQEKIYDLIYKNFGINKYEKGIEAKRDAFDRDIKVYEKLINKLRKELDGEKKFKPLKNQSLDDFITINEAIPDEKKGLNFKKEYFFEVVQVGKEQYEHQDKMKKKAEDELRKLIFSQKERGDYNSTEKNILILKKEVKFRTDKLIELQNIIKGFANNYVHVNEKVERISDRIRGNEYFIRVAKNNKSYLTEALRTKNSYKTLISLYEKTTSINAENESIGNILRAENEITSEIYKTTNNVKTKDQFVEPNPTQAEIQTKKENMKTKEELFTELKHLGL